MGTTKHFHRRLASDPKTGADPLLLLQTLLVVSVAGVEVYRSQTTSPPTFTTVTASFTGPGDYPVADVSVKHLRIKSFNF